MTNARGRQLRPGECPDDIFLRHLMGRGLLYLLRGVAAALLMPIACLECLRGNRRVPRQVWLSWLCSAAIYLSGWGIWLLSSRTAVEGQNRAGEIFNLGLAILIAAIVSGRLRATGHFSSAVISDAGVWGRGFAHHHHRPHARRRHGRRGDPIQDGKSRTFWAESSGRTQPTAAPDAACDGDCRSCSWELCLKTGKPRRRVS